MPRVLYLLGSLLLCLLTRAALGRNQESPPAPTSHAALDEAEILLKKGKTGEALSLLNAVAKKDPKAAGLEAKLGKAYFQSRQFSPATAHLKAALDENAGDLQSTQLLAISFYSLGNCHDALPLLEKLGTQVPKNIPDAPYLVSICQVMTGQLDKARDSLAHRFFVPPDGAMAYLMLGKLLVRQRMVDKAVPQIERALSLDPRLPMAHFVLGEIDLYQSNPDGAVVEFQKELAVNPTLWLVYWRLGDSYMRMTKYDEAEKALKEAIWLNDASAEPIALLGEIALKKGDPALASGFFERALALDPQNLDAHESLAKAYKELGRESDANQQIEIAKRLRNRRPAGEQSAAQPQP
jgi:tetratricopeptide (TPR) repeat protein